MKTYLITALFVAVISGFVQSPSAEEVRFDISGRITNISDPDNVLSGTGITVNVSTFTGTIIYESDATPIEPPSSIEAHYQGTSFTVVIDNSYTTSSSSPIVSIYNDSPGTPPWLFDVIECEGINENDISSNLPGSINELYFVLVSYFTASNGPLTGIHLPLALAIEEFMEDRIINISGVNSLSIEGEIDTLERIYPDDDDDGVPNHLDLCPNTPAGLIVKVNGCLEGDYDNDGDVDGSDLGEFSNLFGTQP